MNIVVTTGHQYPVGTALTNRIRSYLEELAALGHSIMVMSYRPSEERGNVQNSPPGSLNGVRYCSSAFTFVKSKNPVIARLVRFYSYPNCLRILSRENKKNHIDILLQASAKSSLIPLFWIFSRIHRIAFVLESSEYPWFFLKKRISNIWDRPLYMNIYYKMFDGILAMTTSLEKFHKEHSNASARVFHLPMTVDMNRFNIDVPRENLITYIGNVSYHKDGVGILLDAFLSIANIFPEWKLVIIGNTSRDGEIKDRAKAANLSDRLLLTGSIHRDAVPTLLCKSKILALARPDGLQSEGGFPTKLGEYLATGNLVVVTRVGDIPIYLIDNVSAIIAEPDSVESFTARLTHAIENYEQLDLVKKSGYSVCLNVFDASVQGKRLANYFCELSTND